VTEPWLWTYVQPLSAVRLVRRTGDSGTLARLMNARVDCGSIRRIADHMLRVAFVRVQVQDSRSANRRPT
jgi:hypothetical protein